MYIAVVFFDTSPGVSLINSAHVRPNWKCSVKRESVPRLRTVTKEPLQIEILFILKPGLCVRCSKDWLGITPQLAVNMLLCIALNDHFIQGIFLSEGTVVPWHSPPVV